MDNNIGKVIKELRLKKNMTQKNLADAINVSDKTVSHWENGDNLPPIDMLNRLSKFFEVSLNDLIKARVYEESDEELIESIVDEFDEVNKRSRKIILLTILVAIIVCTLLLMTNIFASTYNRFKVYKVTLESDDFYYTTGIYVETKIKDSLFLNDIKIKRYTPNTSDIVTLDFYYLENDKKQILERYTELNGFQFYSNDSYIPIDNLSKFFDNLYLSVSIINKDNKTFEYTGKLKFNLDFSNNKIYSQSNNYYNRNDGTYLSKDEIKKILLNNGYKIIISNVFEKETKQERIIYNYDTNTIIYNCDKNGIQYEYSYMINHSKIDVRVVNEDNIEIENYSYNSYLDKLIECRTGVCNSYKEVMDVLNDKILRFLKK